MTNTSWTTPNVHITEVPFDYDLHAFRVETLDGHYLGDIIPPSIDAMHSIQTALNAGQCPITDHWEDGLGHPCTLTGWDEPAPWEQSPGNST